MRELRRSDSRQVSILSLLRPYSTEELCRFFVEAPRCRYQIQNSVRCDRTFLADAMDGLYVKRNSA